MTDRLNGLAAIQEQDTGGYLEIAVMAVAISGRWIHFMDLDG
ncbi:MAG: hypothetical protein ACFFD4_37665 [Candidatus Odinarchaeota archaeon]